MRPQIFPHGTLGVLEVPSEADRAVVVWSIVVFGALWGLFWWNHWRQRERRYPSKWIARLVRERRARRRLWRKRWRALRAVVGRWFWRPMRWCPCATCAGVRRVAWLEDVRSRLFAGVLVDDVLVSPRERAYLVGLVEAYRGPGRPPIFPPVEFVDDMGRRTFSIAGLVERLAHPPSGAAGRSGVRRPSMRAGGSCRGPAIPPAPGSLVQYQRTYAGLPVQIDPNLADDQVLFVSPKAFAQLKDLAP